MRKVPPLARIHTGDLTKPPVPILVNDRVVRHAPDWAAASAMVKKLAATRKRAEETLKRVDPARYLRLLDTCEAPPFAVIELGHDRKRCLYVVRVNERTIAEYPQRQEADARVSDLVRFQHGIERRLLAFDPAEYWRRRAGFLQEAAEHNEREAERHFMRASVADWAESWRQQQRVSASRKLGRPRKRTPLRQEIFEAMRIRRADGLDQLQVLVSLMRSPVGDLRVTKVDDIYWRFENESEDWPPVELSYKTTLKNYFAEAGKK